LSVVTIRVPSLCERAEDVPALVKFFIQRYAREVGVETPAIQPEAVNFLQTQAWPGNVRELENIVRQALLLARPLAISVEHVRQVLATARQPTAVEGQTHKAYVAELLGRVQRGEEQNAYLKLIADLEPELFTQAIQLAGGNQAKAARWLGVSRARVREKLIQLGLHPAAEKTEAE
jgi:DNA-binding NtrC family response regulator